MAVLIILLLFFMMGAIALTAMLVIRGSAKSEAITRAVEIGVVLEERKRSDRVPRAVAVLSLLVLPIGLYFAALAALGAAMSAGSGSGGGFIVVIAFLLPLGLSAFALLFASTKTTRVLACVPLVSLVGLIITIVAFRK